MPLPQPSKGEAEKDFISRCAGNSTMVSEYPDNKQRLAICYSQYKRHKKSVDQLDLVDWLLNKKEKEKISQKEAEYVDHPVDAKRCFICSMFINPSSCTLVEGTIASHGYCKYFEAKVKKLLEALQKGHTPSEVGSGFIDPDTAEPVSLPVANDDIRAQVMHIGIQWILKDPSNITTKTVLISDVVALQKEVDPKRVEDHAKEYEEKGKYDEPPLVVDLNDKYYILDGHHRIEGAKQTGAKELEMSVIPSNVDKTLREIWDKNKVSSAEFVDLLKSVGWGDVAKVGPGTRQMIVGITGPSGARKTVVAKHLKRQHGFARIHAGEPVKRAIRKGFRLSKAQTAGEAKDKPTIKLGGTAPRAVMEVVGTGIHAVAPMATSMVMRKRIVKRLAKGKHVVIDGVRSEEEADIIHKMGGSIWRADNGKGINPDLPMDKRQATLSADHTIDTIGSKKDIKQACDQMMQRAMSLVY